MDAPTARTLLAEIAADMQADAKAFEGRPLAGRTVAEYFGNQGAAIARLAGIVETLLPSEDEPERDPVPYVDYLPDPIWTEPDLGDPIVKGELGAVKP